MIGYLVLQKGVADQPCYR